MSSITELNNEMSSKTWSLTVGNGGENHTGMEFLGSLRKQGQGWDINKLRYGKRILEDIFGILTWSPRSANNLSQLIFYDVFRFLTWGPRSAGG